MSPSILKIGRILTAALAIGMPLTGEARADCTTLLTGLRFPLGVSWSNQRNLLVSETGITGVPHSGRISIVDIDGVRRTLLDGLPSATNDVNEASGPSGLLMRGRTLYVAIGIGDAILVAAPGSPVRLGNPNPSSPIFSSVLAIRFSAHAEKTTEGFSLSPDDYDALANRQTVQLSDGAGETLTIELVANFPDYVANPLPGAPENVRGSNPFDLALIGNQLYVTDGGRNLVWRADIHSGQFSTFTTFDLIPNPTPVGPPTLEAVPTGIRELEGELLVTLFRGFPFPPGASSIERIDPATGARTLILTRLRTAIDVLGSDGQSSLFVLEHASGALLPPFSGPGSLTYQDGTGSTVLANCFGRPTSMVRDARSGAFYITELVNGRLTMVVP